MADVAVIAHGGNSLEIPCLTFERKEHAENFLTDVFGQPEVVSWGDGKNWGSDKTETEMARLMDRIFTSYYDGCGGVDFFTVRKVRHSIPFVCFDLD